MGGGAAHAARAPELVRVERRGDDGMAVVWMDRPPVNALSAALWEQLLAALDGVERDGATRAVVFASALPRAVFSAGIDLHELSIDHTDATRFRRFWLSMTSFLTRLYASPLLTAAAIRGQCPAGGCAISLACDYRVIDRAGAIGLNEARIGIPVPRFWAELFLGCVGAARGEWMLLSGEMASAERALELGLVHQVVRAEDDDADVLHRAETALRRAVREGDSPPSSSAAAAIKSSLRADFARRWSDFAEQEASDTWQLMQTHATAQTIRSYLKSLARM